MQGYRKPWLALVVILLFAAVFFSFRGRIFMAKPKPESVKPKVMDKLQADHAVKLDKYWENAREDVYKSVLEILAQHRTELARNLKYHKLMHGNLHKNKLRLPLMMGRI